MRSNGHLPTTTIRPSLAFALLAFLGLACSAGRDGDGLTSAALPTSSPGAPGGSNPPGTPEKIVSSPPVSTVVLDNARITSDPRSPSYQRVSGDVVLDAPRHANVTLVVDLESTCFPFSKWELDPPPPGQRWPASCDAFDRAFEITLVDPQDPSAPAIELVHAATPFGGPLHIEQDVTDVFNGIGAAPRQLQVYISSMADANGQVSGSAGGWNVTAKLVTQAGPAPRDVIAVLPLHYGPITAASASRTFDFDLPAGTTSARIEYVATGHGGGTDSGCIGPAEEFCRREHVLTLDGAPLATLDPWRTDCASLCTLVPGGPGGRSYCAENPCGLPSSVRAPRANWCPGSVTEPWTFDLPGVTAGPHSLGVAINRIAERGSWRVAAKVIAYR